MIVLAVLAALLAYGTGLFVPAVINALASFWSNGVLANFRKDPEAAPNAAAAVSIVTTVASVGLLIAILVFR